MNQLPCRKATISTRLLDDGTAVVFDPDRAIELFLNPTGLLIWSMLDAEHSHSDIAEAIGQQFESYTDIYQDIDNYIKMLGENGLLGEPDQIADMQRQFPSHADAPVSLDLSITGHCNLSCPFCYYSDAIKTRHDLPLSDWQKFFAELASLSVRELSLSGGEIFCRTDLFAMIDSIIESRMRYSLITNGTLANDSARKALLEPKRRRRLGSIQVSVDGSCPEVHDQIRGAGSFAASLDFLRWLKAEGFPTTVRVTIGPHNLNDLEKIFSLLLDDVGLKSVGTNSACALGSAVDNANAVIFTPAQRLQAMQTLRHLAEEVWPGRIGAQAGPLYESRQFESMEQHKRHAPTYNGHLNACGCFRSKLAIHHDGVIIPCNMLGNVELGRINQDNISAVWRNHPTLKKLAARTAVRLSDIEGCQNCEYADICNGGCPAEVISSTGDFCKPSLSNCYRQFLQSLKIPPSSENK